MERTRGAATGSQTLARGLHALELVAGAREGLGVQDLASLLDVHRSIASRLLATLADFRLVVRGADGRYRAGAGLAALASGVHGTLRAAAEPVMRELAEELGATVSLLVVEGDEAVALSVVEPRDAAYVLSFKTGSRHPLDRGSAGVALRAAQGERPGESADVAAARAQGYAATYGEVEPGAHGVAVPLAPVDGLPTACLNLITYRADIAESAPAALVAAASRLAASLA